MVEQKRKRLMTIIIILLIIIILVAYIIYRKVSIDKSNSESLQQENIDNQNSNVDQSKDDARIEKKFTIEIPIK